MAVLSKCFYYGHRSTVAGSFLIRNNNETPVSSSSDFELHLSTTSVSVCNLTPSQTARITEPFNLSLIAWVVGRKIRPRYLAGHLHRFLRLAGDLIVTELGLGYFVLRFSECSDYNKALEERPWPIPNLCISVFPWIPNFKPSEATISSVDVWIRLHELCLEYYDREVLHRIAETIGGRLVKIDPVTERLEKCMYARICIRINLCNPLPPIIHLVKIRQEIEYEGLDSLCSVCRRVGDLKHDCLSKPCSCSGFSTHHHRARSFQGIGSSSKQLQAPSEPSACGSGFQVLGKEALLDLNDLPSLPVGDCEKGATSFPKLPQKKHQFPGLIAKPTETQKAKCGFSVQTNPEASPITIKAPESKHNRFIQSMALRSHPVSISSNLEAASSIIKAPELKQNYLTRSMALHSHPVSISSNPEATSMTIKAPAELKYSNLLQSMALAPSVVEDQFRAAKTSTPTMLAVHTNQPQPSSTAGITSLVPSLVSEASLKFYSAGIQRSTRKKDIIDTPFKETSVHNCPVVYVINPKISSVAIALSEVPTMVSNHNQYVIKFVPTSRGGNECGVGGSESASVSASCSEKILCWNFRGTAIASLIRALKDLIQVYEPSIVLIFGTKISGAAADQVVQELAFCGSYRRKPDDYIGGVWLLLSRQDVQTEVNSYSSQQVSASVHFKPMLGLFDALYRYRNTPRTLGTDFLLYLDELDG